MATTASATFNRVAPLPAMIRRELALAANEVAAFKAEARKSHVRDLETAKKEREDEERDAAEDAMMAFYEMAAAVYRETQVRLLEMFETDAEASRRALAAIDEKLAALEQERAVMIEKAVKRDDGTAVFMSEDGTTIYTADGEKLSEEEAAKLLAEQREALGAAEPWEQYAAHQKIIAALEADRAALLEWESQRAAWQVKVESGELTQEQMEDLERAYEASVPASVKALRAEVESEKTAALSTTELAATAGPSAMLAGGFNKLAEGATDEIAIALPAPAEQAAQKSAPQALTR